MAAAFAPPKEKGLAALFSVVLAGVPNMGLFSALLAPPKRPVPGPFELVSVPKENPVFAGGGPAGVVVESPPNIFVGALAAGVELLPKLNGFLSPEFALKLKLISGVTLTRR